ncbi:MAG: TIGR01777 family oxidoreductase [Candidatus Thermoplasmatota archaeon]|nr:TIGR01777 family oxidoreductase [Candidatus Thermoplasmatota archaeon]
MQNKAVIFGGTGAIGGAVGESLKKAGWTVTVVTRNPDKAQVSFADSIVSFTDDKKIVKEISGARAVLNFSGASINSTKKLDLIEESRVILTARVTNLISASKPRPEVFVNGSAAGYYGAEETDDLKFTEESPAGKDYWGNMVAKWEKAAEGASDLGVRVVNVRTSLFLDPNSGTLGEMIPLFRKRMGGYVKPGRQWVSWIHRDDEVSLILECINNSSISGPINASSPNPVRMKDFASSIGKHLGKSGTMAIPQFVVKLRFGKAASLLINGGAAMPEKAESMGFKFRYPTLEVALTSLLGGNKD